MEYLYRIDSMTTLRQRLHDGVFRARRIVDAAAYARDANSHWQTRQALAGRASDRAVLQMSWWKTLDRATEATFEHPSLPPRPIQRVRADLPFFAAFAWGDDERLDDAWLMWGDEALETSHYNPYLSDKGLPHAHFEILSPQGTWQPFEQAACFERGNDERAFDLTLPPLHPAGFPFRLRVHAFEVAGERWLLVRNRASEIMALPLFAPVAYRDLAAELTWRVPDLARCRIALSFEGAGDVRLAEIERPAHRWRDRLRSRPAPAWEGAMLDHEVAARLLRAAGLGDLVGADHRFAYDPAALEMLGVAVPPDAALSYGFSCRKSLADLDNLGENALMST